MGLSSTLGDPSLQRKKGGSGLRVKNRSLVKKAVIKEEKQHERKESARFGKRK